MKQIGILGGGQLGRMFLQNALNHAVDLQLLDPNPQAPCAFFGGFQTGDFGDYETVLSFGKGLGAITIEIETVNTDALHELESRGVEVFPSAKSIATIKNKRKQKAHFLAHGLPTTPFVDVADAASLKKVNQERPGVFKANEGGYDGRGVWVYPSKGMETDFPGIPGFYEELAPIKKELAVLVASDGKGQTAVYDPVEMVFHPEANLLDYLLVPANVPAELLESAKQLAKAVAESFPIKGLLAVELFWTTSGELLVNEVAPRPHNSGHHTIEACYSSQYDQLLRIMMGFPLGDPALRSAAGIVNMVGGQHPGKAHLVGMGNLVQSRGVYPHWYGKTQSKPMRKMGHYTVLGKDTKEVSQKINSIKGSLRIDGTEA